MRIFLYSIAVVACFFFVLLIIGVVNPTSYIRTETRIATPTQTVYEAFINPNNLPLWISGLNEVEVTKGAAGEIGAKYLLSFAENGNEFVLVEQVIDIQPPHRFSFTAEHKMFTMHHTISFLPKGNDTKVMVENKIEGKGIWKAIIPIMKPSMQKQQEEDYQRFKELVESQN